MNVKVEGEVLRKLLRLCAVNFQPGEFPDNRFVSLLYYDRVKNPALTITAARYAELVRIYRKYRRRAERNARD